MHVLLLTCFAFSFQHYEHLDKAFDAFLRKQSTLADSYAAVKKMIDTHQEFKASIEVSVSIVKPTGTFLSPLVLV